MFCRGDEHLLLARSINCRLRFIRPKFGN